MNYRHSYHAGNFADVLKHAVLAQIITYLKLSGHKLGYLINWNVPVLKDGLKRYVNGL
jgi:23S rRNA A2030 N6-methylase RlmJ